MVWETKCVTILMLTKEIENSWVKCDSYFPSSKHKAFYAEKFTIELLDSDETPELTRRNLLLKLEGVFFHKSIEREKNFIQFLFFFFFKDETPRKIHHLHYTEWPDHGLPVSTTHFLELVRFANEANHIDAPFIVHCSAGLGRSGVFCAVHSILEKIKYDLTNGVQDPVINLVGTILKMRQQRPAMIQTLVKFLS